MSGFGVLVLFMATPCEKRERQDRILAELSELGLALARDLQACALAAVEPAAKAELSLAFQRTSRSVRQSLALEARFDRDRLAAAREDRDIAKRAEAFRAARRRAQVKLGVERCIWDEAEDAEAEALLADLDDYLERDALADLFAGDDPIEAHIARLCAELGVDTPETRAARREEPDGAVADAPAQVHDGPAPRRSSG
jgi:phosphoglycolate phosphatase-like HAD superfamily hydrolase